MTTIAYRDGVMAADTVAFGGGIKLARLVKIARNDAGDLAGAVGDAGFAFAFLEWFRKGEPEPAIKLVSDRAEDRWDKALIVRAAGRQIEVYEPYGRFPVSAPYFAIGSGKSVALGAMFMGATAVQAVQAAIALDEGSSGEAMALVHETRR